MYLGSRIAEAGRRAITAGVDMSMVDGIYTRRLPALVASGALPMPVLDEAVRRVLRAKYRTGLFADPYRYIDPVREAQRTLTPAHRRAARAIARQSIVMLKNEGGVLPLSKTPAILVTWQLGVDMGHVVADILFGDVNPSGKLPVTFPRVTGQELLYYNGKPTGRPPSTAHKYNSKYVDVDWTPLYPFDYGLSYTTFTYDRMALSAPRISRRDALTVSVEVTNTGSRAGAEVVQLYVRDEVASVTRPVRELKGFIPAHRARSGRATDDIVHAPSGRSPLLGTRWGMDGRARLVHGLCGAVERRSARDAVRVDALRAGASQTVPGTWPTKRLALYGARAFLAQRWHVDLCYVRTGRIVVFSQVSGVGETRRGFPPAPDTQFVQDIVYVILAGNRKS